MSSPSTIFHSTDRLTGRGKKKLRKRVILHTQKTLIAISSAMVQKLALLLQIRRTLSLRQFASKYSLFSLDRNLWCAICQLYTASRQRHVTQHAVLQSQTKQKHLSFLFEFLGQILLFGWNSTNSSLVVALNSRKIVFFCFVLLLYDVSVYCFLFLFLA